MSARSEVFTMRQKGPEGGDCTAPYAVSLKKKVTLQEFIDAVLTDKDEWGFITVYCTGVKAECRETSADFRYGNVNIPKDMKKLLDKTVKHASASGGWSRMDYVLELE